jgi:hypothetical protein
MFEEQIILVVYRSKCCLSPFLKLPSFKHHYILVEIQPKLLLRNWRPPSSEIWHHVALYKFTDVSEGHIASICTIELHMTVFHPEDKCKYICWWIFYIYIYKRLHCQIPNHCLQTHSIYFSLLLFFSDIFLYQGVFLVVIITLSNVSLITQRTIRKSCFNNYKDFLMIEDVLRRKMLENW